MASLVTAERAQAEAAHLHAVSCCMLYCTPMPMGAALCSLSHHIFGLKSVELFLKYSVLP